MRGIGVAAECRANAVKFVGGDSSTDTTAADQYAYLRVAVLHRFTYLDRVVRVVIRDSAVVRAKIDEIVTRMAQLVDYPFVEGITAMICSDCYAHKTLDGIHMIFHDLQDRSCQS